MYKVTACNQHNIPVALSNFMPCCHEGYEKAEAEMWRVLNEAKTAQDAVNALNAHKWTVDTFTVNMPLRNGFILETVDYCGNHYYIHVKKNIETVCYGETQIWDTKEKAMSHFADCVLNSEGAEQSRYATILAKIVLGETYCTD